MLPKAEGATLKEWLGENELWAARSTTIATIAMIPCQVEQEVEV